MNGFVLVAEGGGGGDGDLAEWLAVAEGWSDDGFQREKKLYKMYRETEIGAQRWRDEEKKVSTTERERGKTFSPHCQRCSVHTHSLENVGG